MMRPAVYILAGGHSRRFGTDKARADCGGRAMIVHVAQAFGPVARSVTAVAQVAGKYADLGLRTIGDARPNMGPLGGLATALADLERGEGGTGGWLMLVSCDLVSVRRAWVERLVEGIEPGVRAVAFRSGFWEPLCALYHRELAGEVNRRLDARRLAMQGLLDDVPTRALTLPKDWPALAQVNTRADLAAYWEQKSRKTGDRTQGADGLG